MHKKENNKYETINQWITDVLCYRFYFLKKYVALIMFFWVNISLSYWKLFWINDLKYLFQLFVLN